MEHTGFPSDETLAAFLDGGLDPETRRRVIEHMTTCDECYSVVAGGGGGTGQIVERDSMTRPRAIQRRAVLSSIAAAVLFVFGWIAFQAFNRPRADHPTPLALLARAAPSKRHYQGRIAGFPFEAFDSPKRGGVDAGSPDVFSGDPDNWAFMQAAAQVKAAAATRPSPVTAHAIGVTQLVYGQAEKAVATLESALLEETQARTVNAAVLASHNSDLLNDLSAAYLARAIDHDEPRDNLLAWNAAEKAWALSRTPEAAWNRAMAASKLNSGELASSAWNAYESVETSPRWKDERQRLAPSTTTDREIDRLPSLIRSADQARLQKIIGQKPRAVREYLEDHLIPEAAGAIAGEHLDESLATALSRRVAQVLAERTGDQLCLDEITHLDMLGGRGLIDASRGLIDYGHARSLYRSGGISEASQLAIRSEEELRHSNDPFAVAACLTRSSCLYYLNDYAHSLEAANRAGSMACGRRWRLACGDSEWLAGMSADVLGRPYDALVSYRGAHEAFQRAGDSWGMAAVDGVLAENLDRLGREGEAAQIRIEALRNLPASDNRRDLLMADLGRAALTTGLPIAAERIAASLIASSSLQRNLAFEAQARAIHSSALRQEGQSQAARAEYAAAINRALDIPESAVRARITSLVLQLVPPDEHDDAAALSTSIVSMEKIEQHPALADLYGRRARLYEQRGDTLLARNDYTRAVQQIAQSLPNIADSDGLSAFVSHNEPFYDGLMRSYLLINEPIMALACSELSRAVLVARDARPLRLPSLEAEAAEVKRTLSAIPPTTIVLDFVVSDDIVTLFVAENGSARSVNLGAVAPAVQRLSGDLAEQDAKGQDSGLRRLYLLLMEPAGVSRGQHERLVVIADSALESVPFSALKDASGKYVVETMLVTRRRSLLGVGSLISRALPLGDSKVLIVATSEFNRGLFPDLRILSEVAEEAHDLASIYKGSTTLIGKSATAKSVTEKAPSADLVYIAAHALLVEEPRLSSCLVLTPAINNASGTLCANDIAALRMRRGSIVVIDACRAGAGGARRAAGASNLATSFLRAGAGAVIAPVAMISDTSGRRMIEGLAHYLQSGVPPDEALRAMQIASISSVGGSVVAAAEWGAVGVFQ